ncbi:ApbE family lipoprotein [Nitritalea halalkaliphila LW7]|uniref:FAD:protein FMN transferase n=1 Tax=Nitritalea halalkaliphila LW7 TaxID=1189621 RepID=I5BZ58_9BACT|nr:FAD:protein FMN transferase [Nitritalea halalkaliphila]EIM74860.1 ApbE family lipoprotein [Nitritalea halalkaliphila LW7]
MTLRGEALGTYYEFVLDREVDVEAEIAAFFKGYNAAANTYIPDSEISYFNQKGYALLEEPYLPEMLAISRKYREQYAGLYEPTLMPLINGWGFGFSERARMSPERVDSLLQFVDLDLVQVSGDSLLAARPGVQLDFSAMGEGYAIEKLAAIVEAKGVESYKIEIGGEMRCRGLNPDGKVWRIGIEGPKDGVSREESELVEIVLLADKAISTSGNYRKFYIDEQGNRRVHVIDPQTGYPVEHALLSATIICSDALKADILATICMVAGPERALALIEADPDVEGFLIIAEGERFRTQASSGLPVLEGN